MSQPYHVTLSVVGNYSTIVEANSLEEAEELVMNLVSDMSSDGELSLEDLVSEVVESSPVE